MLLSIALLIATIIGARIIQEKNEAAFLAHHLKGADLRNNCAPGQLVEFLIGATSVYVDVHSDLDIPELIEVPEPVVGCPSTPLKIDTLVFFNRRVLAIDPSGFEVPHGIRVRLIRVSEQFRSPNEYHRDLCSGIPSATTQQIEDRTPDFIRDSFPDTRDYCLRYSDAEPSSDAIVAISCGSPAGPMRNCESFQILDALGIRYQIYPTAFPIPGYAEATTTDPATESGALLLFNQRLRKWVHGLVQKP